MNLYFLLEDSKSSFKVFPKWLNFILPNFSQVPSLTDLQGSENKLAIASGFGYPSITKYFEETLRTIKQLIIPVDYIILCWDTDAKPEYTIEQSKKRFLDIYIKYPNTCQLKMFVMDRCFETWLLGNRNAYFSAINKIAFSDFQNFYNVGHFDPEKMNAPIDSPTIVHYHLKYLQQMLKSGFNTNYSKRSPMFVATKTYYEELINRSVSTKDLNSFREFVSFFLTLREN